MNPIDRLLEVSTLYDVKHQERLGENRLLITFWDGSRLLITAENA
ncbi:MULTISPECIES: hypothetical protein [Microbacterium]|nr:MULTISPECIES: hypothetical protein [Microbacterium]